MTILVQGINTDSTNMNTRHDTHAGSWGPIRLLPNVSVMHSSCRAPCLWLAKDVTLSSKWHVHVHTHPSIFTCTACSPAKVKPHTRPTYMWESFRYEKTWEAISSGPFWWTHARFILVGQILPLAVLTSESMQGRALRCGRLCAMPQIPWLISIGPLSWLEWTVARFICIRFLSH